MNGGEISSFLEKLNGDPQLQQSYMKDPRAALQQAGLSQGAVDTIMSRDLGKIRAAIEQELPGVKAYCFMVVI